MGKYKPRTVTLPLSVQHLDGDWSRYIWIDIFITISRVLGRNNVIVVEIDMYKAPGAYR